ncbi:MAG: metalloregulator ArsR/SmtB family transcription factor [Nitrososphaerota archaeon]|nr:ArsR family transcriptional regulator [Candidatus Bathyarchaeota archaeon]MDW8048930.1 metalloregulator ArsR/SmtB family transcription factor [Nitrososphaerota archaeon]
MENEFGQNNGNTCFLEVLKALSNPQRLKILASLASGRYTVTELSEKLKMSPPLVFLHLRKLVRAGLVMEGERETIAREGLPPLNKSYYEIRDFKFEISPKKILEEVNQWC